MVVKRRIWSEEESEKLTGVEEVALSVSVRLMPYKQRDRLRTCFLHLCWPHGHVLARGIQAEIRCLTVGLGAHFLPVLSSLPRG